MTMESTRGIGPDLIPDFGAGVNDLWLPRPTRREQRQGMKRLWDWWLKQIAKRKGNGATTA